MKDDFHRKLHEDCGNLEVDLIKNISDNFDLPLERCSEIAGTLAYLWMKNAELAQEILDLKDCLSKGNAADIQGSLIEIHSLFPIIQDTIREKMEDLSILINQISPAVIVSFNPTIEGQITKWSSLKGFTVSDQLEWYFSRKEISARKVVIVGFQDRITTLRLSIKVDDEQFERAFEINSEGQVSEIQIEK